MGWANCGTDSKDRPIGYAHDAVCDHPGCDAKIHRGLAYACGGMHGTCGDQACEGYFCEKHLRVVETVNGFTDELGSGQLCEACYAERAKSIGKLALAGDIKCEWVA